MKNALNNQVGMLGGMFLWIVANLKQGVIYFIKQACGNDIRASVYVVNMKNELKLTFYQVAIMCTELSQIFID